MLECAIMLVGFLVNAYPVIESMLERVETVKMEMVILHFGTFFDFSIITLEGNWCAGPAAENVFSNFSLLLTENPVDKELDKVDMGVLYGANKVKSSPSIGDIDKMEDDEKLIDEDDRLYFPPEAKEIDLSKHIRDLFNVVHSPSRSTPPRTVVLVGMSDDSILDSGEPRWVRTKVCVVERPTDWEVRQFLQQSRRTRQLCDRNKALASRSGGSGVDLEEES
ncbi:hypothetical protein KSP40_PGU010916 [Platanthera guangdongensis]|uniref:Uncharacterized protein n=1 Tax=Platanthera guangdongensis TaxID=2320717 RepID=A0ABR2N203_9ASPA